MTTLTLSKDLNEAEQRLAQRKFKSDCVKCQLDNKSLRMKRQFMDSRRNAKFDYICSLKVKLEPDKEPDKETEMIIAETNDFLFRYIFKEETKKTFIVKNSPRHKSLEEEALIETVRTEKQLDNKENQERMQLFEIDLFVIGDYVHKQLETYMHQYDNWDLETLHNLHRK